MTEGMNGGELASALSKFQGEMPSVGKGKTAIIKSDKGSYSYKYADLGDVVAAAYPVMSKFGLAFSARPTLNTDGHLVLAYRLMHESGEFEGGEYPLPANGTPQQMGSAITYARRYVFCAVTGVVAEEDTDGRDAPQEREPTARARKTAPPRKTRSGESATPDPITDQQVKKIHTMLSSSGWPREDVLAFYEKEGGRLVTSSKDLTKREAMKVIDALEKLNHGGRLVPEGVNAETGEVTT